MKYKIELKTKIFNDSQKKRMPSLEKIKEAIDVYSKNGKGLLVKHDSVFDYQYNTRVDGYNTVDSLAVVGHITNSVIEDDKLFLIVNINNNESLDYKCICFFRSRMQNTADNEDNTFNLFDIFAVDLIVANSVSEGNISIVEKLK